MKIHESIIREKNKRVYTADDYRLPSDTLGNPPKRVKKALDNSFDAVRSVLSHSLENLADEGMPAFIGYGALAGLAQNGLIRAGVSMRADEMTRKWGKFVTAGNNGDDNTDKNSDVLKRLKQDSTAFKIKALLNKVSNYCGYFGGCLVFVDTGEDAKELVNPLRLTAQTFKLGSLRGFKLIEPYLVTPGVYNSYNPLANDYYKPSVWYIQGVPVHESRLLYFTENELPSLLKPAYNFFGLPLSQKVLDAVAHYTSSRESAARLLKKYSITVLKTDMSAALSGDFDTNLMRRVDYFTQMRDNDGTAIIDKEMEDLVVMTTSLAGVVDIVRQAMEYVAAMFNEPVTKMWGLSPNGFNTGDADLKNHYDNIASLQEKMFQTQMDRIVRILQMNAFGEINDNIEFKFTPLNEEDMALKVANNKVKAETDALLLANNVVSPEEVRQKLIDDDESGYNGLTPNDIPELDPNELGELEPFKEEPEEGLMHGEKNTIRTEPAEQRP
jgi:phage-related protein (TIGR01555 family)|nr:MAG TPA: portal [Caudoviricetes sp.]